MQNPFNSGPQAPERNPPINPQFYKPRLFDISNITFGITTLVTTTINHDYVVGQLVRLIIPFTYGAQQLDEQQGYVISIPASNQVVLTINSLGSNAFNPTPIYGPTLPQIAAIGDVNSGPINTGRTGNQTFISGSFINISPN